MENLEESEVIERMKDVLGEDLVEAMFPRKRRVFVQVRKKALIKAVKHLVKEGFVHLSTITGVDLGDEIELIYHLNRGGIELSLKTRVVKDKPTIPSITSIIPGATLYEREVYEMFGVIFEGHPNLSHLLLPEDWPEGVYPLRKG